MHGNLHKPGHCSMRARMKEKEQEKTWPILQEILIQLLRGQPLSGKQTKKKP